MLLLVQHCPNCQQRQTACLVAAVWQVEESAEASR